MKWMSTREFANLVDDHTPVTPGLIRDLCEEGTIPPEYAKRIPGREQGHWRIAVKGMRYILENVLKLTPKEILEVKQKAKLNFKFGLAA